MRKYYRMFDDIIHRRLRAPYTLYLEELRRPKRPRATIVLVHGIGSSTFMWQKLSADLPDDVRIVAVDLLGFGRSPQPSWAKYDAGTQAKSLIKTLILHRVPLGSIIVGHSLGALVVVELARRIPLYASKLLLISPPIYKPTRNKVVATQPEDLLRGIYKIIQRYPKNTERALLLAKRYYIRKTGSKTTPGVNITSFFASLEASIINQSTIDHIHTIRLPIVLMGGTRDPLVINRNLSKIAGRSGNIEHHIVKKAGHNVVGVMRQAVANQLERLIEAEEG